MNTKKILSLLLAAALLLSFCACGTNENSDAVQLKFSDTIGIDALRKLNGQKVTINGYIATSSPADGSFIFLMNLPYQSCPFCVPNTSQLANTIEVYPKKGEKLDYSNQAVRVTGTLAVTSEGGSPYTDPYGYEFYYKIVDAEYTIIKLSEISGRLAVWQKVAEADLVSELYSMFDYLYFTVNWPEFFVENWTDENGTLQPGYYLYASDAVRAITETGSQYNYGYTDGYFEKLQSKFEKIDKKELQDIVEIISECKALATKSVNDLLNGNYTYAEQYVEKFNTTDTIFKLNNGASLVSEYENLYNKFSVWISSWEI